MAVDGRTPGEDLASIPFGDLIYSVAAAIADGQFQLDKSGMRVAEFMGGHALLRDIDTGQLLTREGQVTQEPQFVNTCVYFGYTYDEKGQRQPNQVSMMELGFVPTFYQFVDTVIELRIAVRLRKADLSQESASGVLTSRPPALTPTSARVTRGGTRAIVTATPIDARYMSSYNYSADMTSKVSTKLVPVPPPPMLEERIRRLVEQEMADRERQASELKERESRTLSAQPLGGPAFDTACYRIGEVDLARQLVTQAFTVEAWVAPKAFRQRDGIVGAYWDQGASAKGWLLGVFDGKFGFALSANGAVTATVVRAPRDYALEAWHHVVGVYDGAEVRLYVDGKLQNRSTEQRGALVYPEFDMTMSDVLRTANRGTPEQVNKLSDDAQRQALIEKLSQLTNQSADYFRALNDYDLIGRGAVAVFLREAKIRGEDWLKSGTAQDHRNTLIVENYGHTGKPGLQGMDNQELVRLGLQWADCPSFVRSRMGSFAIGAYPGPEGLRPFSGEIDEVRLWDRALDGNRVERDMDVRLQGKEQGLVGYWRLDKTHGDVVPDAVAGHDAKKKTLLFTELKGKTFGGAVAPVDCGPIELKDRSFTIEFWARRKSKDAQMFAVCHGTVNQGLLCGFRAENGFVLSFWYNDIDTKQAYAETGEWHHWACVYDHAQRDRFIYRDGEQVAGDKSKADYAGRGVLLIGARQGGADKFDGEIAEVRIWSVARTPEQIRRTKNLHLTGKENALVLYRSLQADA